MTLYALKCPNCNGDIQLNPDKEFGFCMYCGTRILNDRPQRDRDRDADIVNYLKLAAVRVRMREWKKADDAADRAIALDADSSDAWWIKAAVHMNDENGRRYAEQARSCDRSRDVFGEKDAQHSRPSKVSFSFVPHWLSSTDWIFTVEIENETVLTVKPGHPCSVRLQEGPYDVRLTSRSRYGSAFKELASVRRIRAYGDICFEISPRTLDGTIELVPMYVRSDSR